MKNQREFFNSMASTWDESQGPSRGDLFMRVVEECRLERGQVVLDAGTGTGVMIPFILEKIGGEGRIIAIDYAGKMIEEFRKKCFPSNVTGMVADMHSTGFSDETFDRVIVNACYPHFEDKKAALMEIYRIMKKNGIFIISHIRGRRFINDLHRRSNRLIGKDIIPGVQELSSEAGSCGFTFLNGADEDDFYFAVFKK